jgi:hypothetical protein
MLGQQEAPLYFRYVETLWDFDCVCFAIIVSDDKLECALSFDCQLIAYPINLSFVFVGTQVLKEMGFVGHVF